MREVELKAIVDDLADRRRKIEEAGAILEFEGTLSDRRYDTTARELSARDEVLRARRYSDSGGIRTFLDWKGPTEVRDSYKVREELTTKVDDFESLETILERLEFALVGQIDRTIAQYRLGNATVRFEIYPRMDVLVEVEGDPAAIEDAIEALGIPRGTFSSERLASFVTAFERRTGVKAALSEGEL
ncbi:MAG TPA: class IV adenylate cyclase [Gemmatimonadaceae bacterium]|jgi:predicted adenylyl cyclase CyaB